MSELSFRAADALERRAGGRIMTGLMIYSNSFGLLGKTDNALELLEESRT